MGISTGVNLDMMIALAKRLKQWIGHPTDSFVLKAGKVSDLVAVTAAKKQPN